MANLYDLKRFDLNLLVIFECIYQHLSISKAAETLFITPSAVSQSLQRLRTQLNDPLFVRSGKGITPTTIAVNLHQHLSDNLNQIEQTIHMMDNSKLEKKFIIYGPQIYCSPKFVKLMNALFIEPDIQVGYHDFAVANDSVENLLHYRKADIVFSTIPVNNRSLICEPFMEVPLVLVCRKDHPRLDSHATLEEILNEKFTWYDVQDPGVKQHQYESESFLAGRKRAFCSSSWNAIITTIQQSDLIGFVPKNYADTFKDQFQLKEVVTPVKLPNTKLYFTYNRASLNNELFNRIMNFMNS